MRQMAKAREIATGVMAVGLLLLVFGGRHFVQAQAPRQSIFVGGAPSREPSDKVSTMRLKFPKGVRSNWHSHSWGQLLMVEAGSGLTQDRGGQVRVVRQLTIYEGDVTWLEPVQDKEYLAPPRK